MKLAHVTQHPDRPWVPLSASSSATGSSRSSPWMCTMKWTGEKMMQVSEKGPATKSQDPVNQGRDCCSEATGVPVTHDPAPIHPWAALSCQQPAASLPTRHWGSSCSGCLPLWLSPQPRSTPTLYHSSLATARFQPKLWVWPGGPCLVVLSVGGPHWAWPSFCVRGDPASCHTGPV